MLYENNTMEMKINFPGGQKVNASFNGFVVQTDQPNSEGGNGSAPEPFSLFLSSIGTCTGIYILKFCRQRRISTEDLTLQLTPIWNNNNLVESIKIVILANETFPEKYKNAVLKAASLCTVKRTLEHPPSIDLSFKRI